MTKKKDEIKDVEVVPTSRNSTGVERTRADRSIVLPTNRSDGELQDELTEALAGNSGSMDVVVADRTRQVAALTISQLNNHQKFDKSSPVLMVWDNRSNQWANFRNLDEVAELFGEVEVYVALPIKYKKLKRGFRLADEDEE